MRLTDTQSRIIFGVSSTLSAFLMFWRINKWSFWFDESYTSALLNTNFSEILKLTSLDVHPPLYYFVLYVWSWVFGASDIALRSMSALFMLASILLLVVLLKRLVEKRYAYLAASFAALAPFTIRYGQEARMYAMVSALLLAATYIFVVQLQRKRRERTARLWIGYAFIMTLALYTHYFAILILASHLAYALFHDTRTKDGKTWLIRLKNRVSLVDRKFLKSLIIIPVLFAPWTGTLINQFQTVNSGFWIPPVDYVSIMSVFTTMTIFTEVFEPGATVWIGYVALAVFVCVVVKVAKTAQASDLRALWFVLAGILFPLAVLTVLSILPFTTSYLYFRYFAQFSMFFYAGLTLVAAFSYKYVSEYVGVALIAVVALLNLYGTQRVLSGTDKIGVDMNVRMERLNEEYAEGDVIIATSMFQWFNARHYNSTTTPVKYLDTGYQWGSHAPIYESDPSILVDQDMLEVNPESGRAWLIESKDSNVAVPDNWSLASTVDGMESTINLYEIN